MYEKSRTINGKYSEKDIITKCIIPSLLFRGYKLDQIKEEYSFSSNKKQYRADIVITKRDSLEILAIIEVKKDDKDLYSGLSQAMVYASILGVFNIFSTAGEDFLMYDRESGMKKNLFLLDFPTYEELLP